jgi:hypothetical protein
MLHRKREREREREREMNKKFEREWGIKRGVFGFYKCYSTQ